MTNQQLGKVTQQDANNVLIARILTRRVRRALHLATLGFLFEGGFPFDHVRDKNILAGKGPTFLAVHRFLPDTPTKG